MKKILLSLLVIAGVAGAALAASQAFFSDVEKSENNIIKAGAIDMSVDDNNPWSTPVEIYDMKPSYVRWTKHVIKNVGPNYFKLWKHIYEVETFNDGWSEQECTEVLGTWVPPVTGGEPGDCVTPQTVQNNIDEYIVYDVYVGGDVVGGNDQNDWLGGHNEGGIVIISEEAGITVADIESIYVYLGELAPDQEITVWQSYHMKDETGNWAQTDKMTFTLEYLAQQVNADNPTSGSNGGEGTHALLLENKEYATDWDPIIDDRWGVLSWAGNDTTFDFTFNGYGLEDGESYALIYYADPWEGNNPGAYIGGGTATGGVLSLSGTPDLNVDMPESTDDNYPTGAKIWLVKSADYNSGSASTGPMTGWNPGDYLFEYNLITYDDTDAP